MILYIFHFQISKSITLTLNIVANSSSLSSKSRRANLLQTTFLRLLIKCISISESNNSIISKARMMIVYTFHFQISRSTTSIVNIFSRSISSIRKSRRAVVCMSHILQMMEQRLYQITRPITRKKYK